MFGNGMGNLDSFGKKLRVYNMNTFIIFLMSLNVYIVANKMILYGFFDAKSVVGGRSRGDLHS